MLVKSDDVTFFLHGDVTASDWIDAFYVLTFKQTGTRDQWLLSQVVKFLHSDPKFKMFAKLSASFERVT